jgi:hypothetical protein
MSTYSVMAVSPQVQYCIMMESPFPPVVTEEKNSPSAAHAGCNRCLQWEPGAWGYRWATCPGGYKYGGLAL